MAGFLMTLQRNKAEPQHGNDSPVLSTATTWYIMATPTSCARPGPWVTTSSWVCTLMVSWAAVPTAARPHPPTPLPPVPVTDPTGPHGG